MNENIVEFPDRKAVEEEAATWLIKLDGDTVPSADELASLREWLARSPVHREQLASLAGLWGKMNVLTELAAPLGHVEGGVMRGPFNKTRDVIPQIARAGFVTAIVVFGIAVAATLLLRSDPFLSSNGFYSTAVGEQQATKLADGSVVLLNTNSQVKVEYENEYRNIRLLQGEAHFTVAKNAERPFQVYAGNKRVQAVGTAFSVYLKDDAIDVTVTEGIVALASVSSASPNQPQQAVNQTTSMPSAGSNAIAGIDFIEVPVTIKAGESVTLPNSSGLNTVSSINAIETVEAREMTKRQSWRGGMLTFYGDRLEDVVNEISRYTTVSIEMDPALRDKRTGGQFPIGGGTEAMFDILEANLGVRVIRLSHDRVLLSAAEE